MKYTLYLNKSQVLDLEYEVISNSLRTYLTRLLFKKLPKDERTIGIQNLLINKARSIVGLPIYLLQATDDCGNYQAAEYVWHNGEFELLFKRLSTIEFVEFLAFILETEFFGELLISIEAINALLEQDGASFYFEETSNGIEVQVIPLFSTSSDKKESEHPNIRVLIERMSDAFQRDDFAGVVHSSAVIFETLAKDIIKIDSIQQKTLKSFFDRYRKDSLLPDEILNYILETYDSRSITPLAAHGSTEIPDISREQAIVLSEMTKAFVKIEYKLNSMVVKDT